jgi:hypothetical protein
MCTFNGSFATSNLPFTIDELLSGAHVGVISDVSIHDDSIVDDNKSTRDETTANAHLNRFNESNNSTINETTTANEHLNGFNEAHKSTIDECDRTTCAGILFWVLKYGD